RRAGPRAVRIKCAHVTRRGGQPRRVAPPGESPLAGRLFARHAGGAGRYNKGGSPHPGGAGMEDHDQRMKVLLREFFVEFMRLFFPLWAARFDFSTLSWLDKEIFPDPPRGERRAADLVARLSTVEVPPRQHALEDWLALVH